MGKIFGFFRLQTTRNLDQVPWTEVTFISGVEIFMDDIRYWGRKKACSKVYSDSCNSFHQLNLNHFIWQNFFHIHCITYLVLIEFSTFFFFFGEFYWTKWYLLYMNSQVGIESLWYGDIYQIWSFDWCSDFKNKTS